MSFLLDTNICSAHLRRPAGLSHRFTQHSGRLFIPTIVLAELHTWAHVRSAKILVAINTLVENEVSVLPYDDECARKFGEVNGGLLKEGITVSPVDMLIASVALRHDFTLVTNNTADFSRIPDLRTADWLED